MKIQCVVSGYSSITRGKIYETTGVDAHPGDRHYSIVDDYGCPCRYPKKIFIIQLQVERNSKISELLNNYVK